MGDDEWDYAGLPDAFYWGKPSELPAQVAGLIDFDTETSGLHPDDGARVSVVSVAWVETGETGPVIRWTAWPFAQGKTGKPEDDGKRDLFSGGEDGEGDVNLGVQEWQALMDWLSRAGDGLSGQNVKFDVPMVRIGVQGLREGTEGSEWAGPDLIDRIRWDTQVAAKELWPLQPTRLKGTGSTSERMLDYEDKEAQALKAYLGPKTNPRYDLVPWDVMRPYAAMDALLACRVRLGQEQAVARGEVAHNGGPDRRTGRAWMRREIGVLQVLAAMERRGLPYDAAASLQIAGQIEQRQREIRAALPYRPEDAKAYYFGKTVDGQPVQLAAPSGGGVVAGRGLEPYSVTPKKREPQMTAEVLDDMERDGVEGVELLMRFNKLSTAASMWYQPYAAGVGADARLRTVFRQVASGFEGEGGTANGRFSVERVNLQAIPHDYRLGGDDGALHGLATPRQLIGRAGAALLGWQLWEFDLEQAELRLAAMWAKCERMLTAIRSGADLHGDTATALFGVVKGESRWFDFRQVAKRGNFSLIFGSSWLTFQRMVKQQCGIRLSDSEAQRVVSEWNGLYPEFRQAIDLHSRKVEHSPAGVKGMPLANGRVRWWRGFEDTHKAFNARVQGSLAELGKDWMLETERLGREWRLDERGLKAGVGAGGLLLTIHDSQVWLLPDKQAKRMSAAIVAAGQACWDAMFPGVPGGVEAKQWAA